MTASQPRDVSGPSTARVEPITYVDVDPLIPTHLGTDAPHVHHRGSDRCLRNVDGPECLSGVALRARVAELEAENERLGRDKRVYREAWHAAVRWRKSMRAERDALQQRLDAVQALAEIQARSYQAQHRADHARNWLDVLALLDVSPVPSQPAPPTGMCQSRDPHPEHVVDGYQCIGQPAPETQPSDTSDIRSRLNALADEWGRASGLESPLMNADITSASPAQRTLWEAASDLREVLATWPSDEDEARAWRLRAWASSRVAEVSEPEAQPTSEAGAWCADHRAPRSECPKWNHAARQQDEPARAEEEQA